MIGTAGLPHVIVRFTVKDVRSVRKVCLLDAFLHRRNHLTAPALGMFARTNFIEEINEKKNTRTHPLGLKTGKNKE